MAIPKPFIAPDGCPALAVRIAASEGTKGRDYTGILDTGFNGFVLMPWTLAAPLAFVPRVAAAVEYANAQRSPTTIAEGIVSVGDRAERGPIVLENDAKEILLGIEFVRVFNFVFVVTPQSVLLIDPRDVPPASAE